MILDVTARERAEMNSTILCADEQVKQLALPVLGCVYERWARDLGAVKVAILGALNWLTIHQGMIAVETSLEQLSSGITASGETPFAGLGITSRSLRTHIDELANADFLNVFRTVEALQGRAGVANIIEINIKKVVEIASTALQSASHVGKIFLRTYDYIHRYYIPSCSFHSLDKSKLLPPVFDAAEQAGKSNAVGVRMLATPKKPRPPAPPRAESVAAVFAQTRKASQDLRDARATAAVTKPVKDIKQEDLQALLDIGMKTYMPSHPRMVVTSKPFGALRKRLIAAGIRDLADFFSWTIRSWENLATQNRQTYLKDPSKIQKGTPIPAGPSFSALAYKLPYFVAAYSSHLSGMSRSVLGKTVEQKQIDRLTHQLATAREENQVLRRTPRRPQPHTTTTPVNVQRSATPRTNDDDLKDIEIPEWVSRDERRKA